MLEGISQRKVEITLDCDKDPKTVFIFRPITGMEALDLPDLTKGLTQGKAAITILDLSIVEIKGVEDKKKFLSDLSVQAINELLEHYTRMNTVTKDDEKNF
jgi:hypothetical protein